MRSHLVVIRLFNKEQVPFVLIYAKEKLYLNSVYLSGIIIARLRTTNFLFFQNDEKFQKSEF